MAGRRRLALDDLDPTQGEDEDAKMSDAAPEGNDAVSDKQDEKSSSSAETPPPKKTPAKGKTVAAKRPPATPAMKGEEPSDEEAPQAATKPPNKRKSTKPVKNAGEKRQEVEEEEQEQEEEKKKPQAKKARSETDKDTKKKKKQKTDDDTPKKTKRRSFVYHPKKNADGTKAKPRDRSMSEIRFYQNSTELLIQRRPVERVVREICQKIVDQRPDLAELLKGGNFRFTEVAIDTLRTASEQFITDLMEFANMNTSHRTRQTLFPKDLHLALWYVQQLKPFANASGTV